MRIAFLTPLDPRLSGVSAYSEDLALALFGAPACGSGERVTLHLFVEGPIRPTRNVAAMPIRPLRAFARLAREYDAVIYQVGNSPIGAGIYEMALRHPGIVVLHEFVLLHLRLWMAIRQGTAGRLLDLVERRYGMRARSDVTRASQGQFSAALFDCPLSEDVIDAAKGLVVHSEYMARLVRLVRPDACVAVVPMGMPVVPPIAKADARAALGLPQHAFVVSSIGHLNPYKRTSSFLWTLKALIAERPDIVCLLIGTRSANYDADAHIRMLGLTDRVRLTGYVPPDALARYIAASDVCVNLRFPTAGETSASALRVMAAGVPVIVSRTGAFDELPDGAVARVDVGAVESELLLEYLRVLIARGDVRAVMGAAGRRYVSTHHAPEAAASRYLAFITSLMPMTSPRPPASWHLE